jgi:N-(2-amino-2-carboxyethyl)-L-glutamate synthase
MNEGILSAIGCTPMVELTRLYENHEIHLFGKLEQLNPGGSIKDRPALNIIRQGLRTGLIQPDTVVIESSSGNMGIGLAQVCSYYNLRFICVVDAKTTAQNVSLLMAYNAEVEIVSDPDPATGEYLPARIRRVEELTRKFQNSFWCNQYANEYNSRAHHQTMDEIVTALKGRLDYLFVATSSCGTLRGCTEYKRQSRLKVKIIAVDAVGSVIFGKEKAKRLIPGHGAAFVPSLYSEGLTDDYICVTDLECVIGCHRLLRQEALLAGGSSGAIVMAIERYLPKIPHGAVCVAIFPDRGERYLDTIYSEQWIQRHFGDISHIWKTPSKTCARETTVI